MGTGWNDGTALWDDPNALWGSSGFPYTPLEAAVEMLIDGDWVNLCDLDGVNYVYGGTRSSVQITRGRSDWGSYVDPTKCTITLNNRDGRWSPRNPTGPYYGKIGRNTPIRVRKTPASDGYLLLPSRSDRLIASGAPGLDVTGDIDVRVDYSADNWGIAAGLMGKFDNDNDKWSWALFVNSNRTLTLRWSDDGHFSGAHDIGSTAGFTVPASGRIAVRATMDVDDGSGNHVVTFYTAPSISDTWTQLGSAVTTTGTTSISFDATTAMNLGDSLDDNTLGLKGKIYNAELRNGINGVVRSGTSFAGDPDSLFFKDSIGVVWNSDSYATFVDPSIRFRGEVTTWPPAWDKSEADKWMPIEASGVLRRMTQGASALRSAMYRYMVRLANPAVAYWPCEDGASATQIASGVDGGLPMVVEFGTPNYGQFSEFECSAAIPTLGTTQWSGPVTEYTNTGILQLRFLLNVPSADAVADGQVLMQFYTTGEAYKWEVSYGTGGTLTLRGYNFEDVLLVDSGALPSGVDDRLMLVAINMYQDGGRINYGVATLTEGDNLHIELFGTPLSGATLGRVTNVVIGPGGILDNVAIGHISVHDEIVNLNDLAQLLKAYRLERAGARVARLCAEEGVPFRAIGDMNDTAFMGPQAPGKLIDLLHECEDADIGILFEPRDRFGVAYRARSSLYNQDPALTLAYTSLSDIEPVEDDQNTKNDITASRNSGGSARKVLSAGPMSVEDVGRYEDTVSLNVNSDAVLADYAGWMLRIGTVDELRYPEIGVSLAGTPLRTSQPLSRQVEDFDIGGRLVITGMPDGQPPDDVSQTGQGFTETLNSYQFDIKVNCTPESVWHVAQYETARYSPDGSTLADDVTSTATSITVFTPTGPVWTHDDGDFDIRVGGEVMTVTGVTGAGPTQTFTVTRSVNTVVKAHTAGEDVGLDDPAVYAI